MNGNYKNKIHIKQGVNPFIKYYKDKLTIEYMGRGLVWIDTASIQSNVPCDVGELIYYFEVKINKFTERGDVSVGLSEIDFPRNKLPGCTKKGGVSIGYRTTGKVLMNKVHMETLMPFTTFDVVGCGINFYSKEVFFTHNGTL